jgi:hypothetical protein
MVMMMNVNLAKGKGQPKLPLLLGLLNHHDCEDISSEEADLILILGQRRAVEMLRHAY